MKGERRDTRRDMEGKEGRQGGWREETRGTGSDIEGKEEKHGGMERGDAKDMDGYERREIKTIKWERTGDKEGYRVEG